MEIDTDQISDDAILALLYLTNFPTTALLEHWKGQDWDANVTDSTRNE